jgi:hypothetical protein
MLTDEQIIAKYGQPGDLKNIVKLDLPFPFRYVVAADKFATVKSMQCHKLVKENFLSVFNDLLTYYGLLELERLGIDLYAGCLNVRLMRGSKTKWSRHSWGIAIDHDPLRNGLKTKWADAQFSKPSYVFMVDTYYKHGFMSYGKEKNYDAMHFEINN